MKTYHFLNDNGTAYGEFKPQLNKWYSVRDEVKLCKNGFHGSVRPLDALSYAPGAIACIREHRGIIVKGRDKIASSEMRVLSKIDATEVLRKFARKCALDVIHRWNAPDVVVRYLKTGDESLRHAARCAASKASTVFQWDVIRGSAAQAAVHAADLNDAWNAINAVHTAWCLPWNAILYPAWEKQNRRLIQMLNSAGLKK